jgi:hypothetical protein
MKGTLMGQEELFGSSKVQNLKRKVKELDAEIGTAVRKKDFTKAKTLTAQQSNLLKELIDLGEAAKK